MSKLVKTPPLVDINLSMVSIHEVTIHLKEPLAPRLGSKRKRLGLQILNGMGRIEILIAKLNESPEQERRVIEKEIERLVHDIQISLQQLEDHGKPLEWYISDLGLSKIFPRTAELFGYGKGMHGNKDAQAHFQQMNILNQLVTISLRLQADLKLINHKYIAHQLAILYQCINQVGGSFTKYKSRIEANFDTVKATLNATEHPQLDIKYQEWLEQLTSDIVADALYSGRLPSQSQPLVEFLYRLQSDATC
ncbi:uncharacterized protein VTP21DRAFT_10037 [Calcarisporiella thermophila]|uniref:uncharacterized protein n=1 Tax=Calcarisporiella thermophila TaxID=911321 RepID=UPI00374210D0